MSLRYQPSGVFIHLVWATNGRLPLLVPSLERSVYRCLQHDAQRMGCQILALGGTEDHVHVLVELPVTLTISDLAKQLKGASSHVANHMGDKSTLFRWQSGYFTLSVSPDGILDLQQYIRDQKTHHADGSQRLILEPASAG